MYRRALTTMATAAILFGAIILASRADAVTPAASSGLRAAAAAIDPSQPVQCACGWGDGGYGYGGYGYGGYGGYPAYGYGGYAGYGSGGYAGYGYGGYSGYGYGYGGYYRPRYYYGYGGYPGGWGYRTGWW